jgi:hypothetical protein
MTKKLTTEELNKYLPQEYQTLIEWRVDGTFINQKEILPNFSLFCKQDNLKILDWTTNLTEETVNQALKKCHE